MRTPIPTPHDIAPFAPFPYEPPSILWLTVILLPLLAVVLVKIFLRNKRTAEDPYHSAITTIERCAQKGALSRDDLAIAIKATKRYIGVVSAMDLSERSPKEIQALLASDPRFSPFSRILAEIEGWRFAPTLPADEIKDGLEKLREVVGEIHSIIQRRDDALPK